MNWDNNKVLIMNKNIIRHNRHINICWLFGSSADLRVKDDEVCKNN